MKSEDGWGDEADIEMASSVPSAAAADANYFQPDWSSPDAAVGTEAPVQDMEVGAESETNEDAANEGDEVDSQWGERLDVLPGYLDNYLVCSQCGDNYDITDPTGLSLSR